jgi:hypothetical protein
VKNCWGISQFAATLVPAHYIRSDTTIFTRDVDVLTPGHRIENGAAVCWINCQRPVHCEVGTHGVVLDSRHGTLE